MLLARAVTKRGEDLLIIGLSDENRRRLADGQPIDINARTHTDVVPGMLHIVIFAGADEASMQQQISELIDQRTAVVPYAPKDGKGRH